MEVFGQLPWKLPWNLSSLFITSEHLSASSEASSRSESEISFTATLETTSETSSDKKSTSASKSFEETFKTYEESSLDSTQGLSETLNQSLQQETSNFLLIISSEILRYQVKVFPGAMRRIRALLLPRPKKVSSCWNWILAPLPWEFQTLIVHLRSDLSFWYTWLPQVILELLCLLTFLENCQRLNSLRNLWRRPW